MDLFTTPELQDIYRLLDTAQLPTDDVADLDLQHFLACGTPGDVRGIIGLEPLGDVGLLRSLVVASSMQSKGCGQQLVRELELHAQAHGMHTLYLLTTTAEAFFARIGYTVQPREQVPTVVQQTHEFSQLCPGTATVMHKQLNAN